MSYFSAHDIMDIYYKLYSLHELNYKMKKINPKVIGVAVLLMTLLVGGIAADKALGEVTMKDNGSRLDDTGIY